jgi:hypothetical protein
MSSRQQSVRKKQSANPKYEPTHAFLEQKSHTLAGIIKSAKMLIVSPLVAGAYQIPTLIYLGQYWSAIKCATVAALTFLILTMALSLADRGLASPASKSDREIED